ncbi:MAG: histidine--tRNA ligase [Acetobacterales bacterium]
MKSLRPVRGTHDLLPADQRQHRHVIDAAREAAALYGYEEVGTPILEFAEVFRRTLGDTSDIVTKEMFTVAQGDEDVVLRPEGTAGVVRAVMTGGLTQSLPLKFFYSGPMFRYERPQKGRQRQFHQVGVELIGVAEPLGDVEVIALAVQFLRRIGVLERTVLEINTLGDTQSRTAYRQVLVDYLSRHRDALSDDSRQRLDRNPLRILDSKHEGDRALIADAPMLGDHLTDSAAAFFDGVRDGLQALDIPCAINPRLVRGLDYYGHTAFEFTTDALGAQGTVLAGGRYDGLMEMMGGPAVPGVGWAAGIERLALLIGEAPAVSRPVAVIPVGDAAEGEALRLTQALRAAGVAADLAFRGNLKRRMARADKVNARVAILIGDDELAAGAGTVRDLDTGSQRRMPLDAIVPFLCGGGSVEEAEDVPAREA